jgi:UDP-2,3-diacylglucosamine hydrolase
MSNSQKKLGIIAGEGSLPRIVSVEALRQGYQTHVIAINQASKNDLQNICTSVELLPFGKFESWLSFLRSHSIDELVVIGKVHKLWALSRIPFFDALGRQAYKRIINLDDFSIHALLADYASEFGFKILPQNKFLKELLVPAGNLNQVLIASPEILADIEYGFAMAKKAAELKVSQTIVVKDKAVMALEAAEGTDETIVRGCKLAKQNALVIKVSWFNQHQELDMPTIGLRTLQTIAKHKGAGLAIEAGSTFVVDLQKCVEFAHQKNLVFIAI